MDAADTDRYGVAGAMLAASITCALSSVSALPNDIENCHPASYSTASVALFVCFASKDSPDNQQSKRTHNTQRNRYRIRPRPWQRRQLRSRQRLANLPLEKRRAAIRPMLPRNRHLRSIVLRRLHTRSIRLHASHILPQFLCDVATQANLAIGVFA